MTPLEMIAEWRKGCSCSDIDSPEQCPECTKELIESLEWKLSKEQERSTKLASSVLAIAEFASNSYQYLEIKNMAWSAYDAFKSEENNNG